MSTYDLSTINGRFADAMRAAGFRTQVEFARAAGLSKQTVGDWMHGRTANIRPENLVRAADALGVEIRWLATGEGPRRRRALLPDVQEAAEILGVMDSDERAAYMTILKRSKAA